jgi:hypothetical protein
MDLTLSGSFSSFVGEEVSSESQDQFGQWIEFASSSMSASDISPNSPSSAKTSSSITSSSLKSIAKSYDDTTVFYNFPSLVQPSHGDRSSLLARHNKKSNFQRLTKKLVELSLSVNLRRSFKVYGTRTPHPLPRNSTRKIGFAAKLGSPAL